MPSDGPWSPWTLPAGFDRFDVMQATKTTVSPTQTTDTQTDVLPADLFQVVLHNDDHNDALHVVRVLMQVFTHSRELATKIMMEAHQRGKAIAEVEEEAAARLHREQLQSFGLSATLEKI